MFTVLATLDFWTRQPSFHHIVKEVWDTQIHGNPMWRLQQKLKSLSRKLTIWSREDIGNVYDKVAKWKLEAQIVEEVDIMQNTDQSREDNNKCHVEYVRWLSMQESLLNQKSQIKWFEEGDCNTKYFHSVIRERRRKLQIHRIKNDKAIGLHQRRRSLRLLSIIIKSCSIYLTMR